MRNLSRKKKRKRKNAVFPLQSRFKRKRSTIVRFDFKLSYHWNICAFTYTQIILGLFSLRSRAVEYETVTCVLTSQNLFDVLWGFMHPECNNDRGHCS